MVTLSWINAQGKAFKTFVKNHFQEIKKNSNTKNWLYCETSGNPAIIWQFEKQ